MFASQRSAVAWRGVPRFACAAPEPSEDTPGHGPCQTQLSIGYQHPSSPAQPWPSCSNYYIWANPKFCGNDLKTVHDFCVDCYPYQSKGTIGTLRYADLPVRIIWGRPLRAALTIPHSVPEPSWSTPSLMNAFDRTVYVFVDLEWTTRYSLCLTPVSTSPTRTLTNTCGKNTHGKSVVLPCTVYEQDFLLPGSVLLVTAASASRQQERLADHAVRSGLLVFEIPGVPQQ